MSKILETNERLFGREVKWQGIDSFYNYDTGYCTLKISHKVSDI